jgi:hypothetical protein
MPSADAHAMVKATRKPTSDISRKQAEAIAADHGLTLLGSKPRLTLMDGDGLYINTVPYKLICHNDVKVYCEQIHTQSHLMLLSMKSDDAIATESQQARELIGV